MGNRLDAIKDLLEETLKKKVKFTITKKIEESSGKLSSVLSRDYQLFQRDHEEALAQCLELLNRSVLEGEYVRYTQTENILGNLIKQIEDILNQEASSNLDSFNALSSTEKTPSNIVNSRLFEIRWESFLQPMLEILRHYRNVIFDVKKKHDFDQKTRIATVRQSFTASKSHSKYNNLLLTHSVIMTMAFDHLLSTENSFLDRLLELSESLSSSSLARSIDSGNLAIEKCNFLIRKIILKLQVTGKTHFLAKGHEEIPFESKEFPLSYCEKWEEESKLYYELSSDWKKNLKGVIGARPIRSRKFREKIMALKQVKDLSKDPKEFEKINSNFGKSIAKINGEDFHTIASSKLLINYNENCRFSFELKKCNEGSICEFIGKSLARIREIQEETGVKNFHPFRIATIKQVEILDKMRPSDESDLDQFAIQISQTQAIIKEYQERIEWCSHRQFTEFLLPPDECLIESGSIRLFVASGISLPINYERERQICEEQQLKLNGLEWKLENWRALIDARNQLESKVRDATETSDLLRRQIEKYEARAESSQFRMIELLALFTSLFAIVASSMSFFGGGKYEPKMIVPFILILAGAIGTIMGIVMIITRVKDLNIMFITYFVMTALLTTLGLFTWRSVIYSLQAGG